MRLKELRKQQKLTQQEVAEKLFISQHGYSNYEIEKTEPNIETLCKLADLFNVSLDYLVGREFKNEIGYLSNEQKNVIFVLKQLNDNQLNEVLSLAVRLLDNK